MPGVAVDLVALLIVILFFAASAGLVRLLAWLQVVSIRRDRS